MVGETEMKSQRAETLKFLCSYGGKILPRSTDGKLRYVGGFTRVLSVDRSVSFSEIMVKLVEFCGYSVILRCQLPKGDLETLISVKSDEDLSNLLEEYDRVAPGSKIRAILTPPASLKKVSPPASVDLPAAAKQPYAAVDRRSSSSGSGSGSGSCSSPRSQPLIGYPVAMAKRSLPVADRVPSYRSSSPPSYGYPVSGRACYYPYYANPKSFCCSPHKNYCH